MVVLIIAFFVFGGKKLPEIGRDLGKGIRAFKKGLAETQDEGGNLLSEKAGDAGHNTDPATNADGAARKKSPASD